MQKVVFLLAFLLLGLIGCETSKPAASSKHEILKNAAEGLKNLSSEPEEAIEIYLEPDSTATDSTK